MLNRGLRRWPPVCGFLVMLVIGPFCLGAAGQSPVIYTSHGEGTVARATGSFPAEGTYTFTSISVTRDVHRGGGGSPTVTTQVSYTVCVLTMSTNIQVCQNGYGTIDNSEFTGDVDYGLNRIPVAVSLKFNSATEPGYLIYASQCNETDNTCVDATPQGGPISVSWRKEDNHVTTTTGVTVETYPHMVTMRTAGWSRYFTAIASGTILGAFAGNLSPTRIGIVRNFTITRDFGPQ